MLLSVVLYFPIVVLAQNWTIVQSAVIDQIKKNWDAWEAAIKQKDLNIWLKECQPTKDFVHWYGEHGSLWSLEAIERFFAKWSKGVNDFYWENLQPSSVKIYGDVAVVYYYVMSNTQSTENKCVRVEQKRMEVFRKIGGKWRWSDAMITSKSID